MKTFQNLAGFSTVTLDRELILGRRYYTLVICLLKGYGFETLGFSYVFRR